MSDENKQTLLQAANISRVFASNLNPQRHPLLIVLHDIAQATAKTLEELAENKQPKE